MSKQSGFSIAPMQEVRLSLINYVGRYPLIFGYLAELGSGRDLLVRQTTDLCVEAPPRSGNSFFVVGFKMANPLAVVAHHHHVPAQVIKAFRLKVPVVTILRNPIDSALAKAAPGNEPFLIGTTLRRWLTFWGRLKSRLELASPVTFESVISNPGGVIDAVNKKYGTGFSTEFPDEKAVFASIEASRRSILGPASDSTPSPNVPDSRTAEMEKILRPMAEAHPRAREALVLYDDVRSQMALRGLSLGPV
jgi:hypothetical protein